MLNKYEVKIMPSADIDIQLIYEYIINNFNSVENADNTIDAIKEKIESLEKVPKRGKEYTSEPWKSRGLRMVFANNYTIFYYVFDEERIVKVVKVAYSKMDFNNLLIEL